MLKLDNFLKKQRKINLRFVLIYLTIISVLRFSSYFVYSKLINGKLVSILIILFVILLLIDLLKTLHQNENIIRRILYGLLILICLVILSNLSSSFGYKFSDQLRKNQIEKYNELAVSIDKFKENDNRYPNNINELIPKYIEKIPIKISTRFSDVYYKKWFAGAKNNEEFYYLCFDDKATGESFCLGECSLWGSIASNEEYFNGWDRCFIKLFN